MNELIKGLECCSQLPCSDCGNCPYEETDCKQGLLGDALSCINRLKAESADKERAYNEEYNLRKDLTRKLKEDKQQAEAQLRELLSALYQRAGEKGFTLYRKDIVELAKDYGYKEEELNVF